MDDEKQMWLGYKHVLGTYQAKRFYSRERMAIDDAYGSDFVDQVVEPFEAKGREAAIAIIKLKTL